MDYALGVIAGEGCFTLGHKRSRGHIYCNPAFIVRLKENDRETLEVIRDAFDGIGNISGDSGRNTVSWCVYGKDNLEHMVKKIRDEAPEGWWKSEKGRNFEVWADIIDIYVGGYNDSDDTAEMFHLAEELNVGNGKEGDWGKYADEAEEDSYGHICGESNSSLDGVCQRRVPTKDETCWDH